MIATYPSQGVRGGNGKKMAVATASISGVSLKNLKYFVGHEGGCFQGDVYIDGKKQGFWSQDSWGGPDHFEFDATEIEKRAKEYFKKNPFVDIVELQRSGKKVEEVDFNNLPMRSELPEIESILMDDLASLTDMFKQYKKWAKNGYTYLVKLECIHGLWPIPREDGSYKGTRTKEAAENAWKEITDKYPYARAKMYSSVEDFVL